MFQADEELVGSKHPKCHARKKKSGTIFLQPEILIDQEFLDFPRINYKFNGRPYKYFYCVDFNANRVTYIIIHPKNLHI